LLASIVIFGVAPAGAGLPPDSCGVAGSPCDDGNFCTQEDRCVAGTCVGAAAFLVGEHARLGNGGNLAGDLTVNEAGGSVRIGRRAETADGVQLVGDDVRLGVGARVFDVAYNVINPGAARARIDGTPVTPVGLPVHHPFCTVTPVACGTTDVGVAPGQQQDLLAPQAYANLIVGDGAMLTLAPGEFAFCSIVVGTDATIAVLGATQSTIDVAERFVMGAGSTLGPAPGSPMPEIHVAGNRAMVGRDGRLDAILVAPDARLRVGRAGALNGRACARTLRTGRNASLTCSATCGDLLVTPNEGCDDGNTDDGDGCSGACLIECNGNVCLPGEFCINDQCLAVTP
jgi:cysteine-rich repeat protein